VSVGWGLKVIFRDVSGEGVDGGEVGEGIYVGCG